MKLIAKNLWTPLIIFWLVGCSGVPYSTKTMPHQFSITKGQVVLHSDFPIAEDHQLFNELTTRLKDLQEELGLRASMEPIHVNLFKDPDRFEKVASPHFLETPVRRAFFVETDTQLTACVQLGDCLAEDLRHEVTHAYLHAIVPKVPLWLDEGLAEYFEVPRNQDGVNETHLNLLMEQFYRDSCRPHLARLASFEPTFDMSQNDYAESWAWVHFLLSSSPANRQLLRDYLTSLKQDERPFSLAVRLEQSINRPDRALTEHLRHLHNERRKAK